MKALPNRIFFTGVPGSKWSGIAQYLEQMEGMNTTDRTPERIYSHNQYSGHVGAYFGNHMEFPAKLDELNLDAPWSDPTAGCKLIKSHDWAYDIEATVMYAKRTDDMVMLVWRDPKTSYDWWLEAGGFDITYPSYTAYINHQVMQEEIVKQNKAIVEYAVKNNVIFNTFDSAFVKDHFDRSIDIKFASDVLVAIVN